MLPLRSDFDFVRRFKTVVERYMELGGDKAGLDIEKDHVIACVRC